MVGFMVGISDGLGDGAGLSVGESVVSNTVRSVVSVSVLVSKLLEATGTSGMDGTLSDKKLGRSQALDTPKSAVTRSAR